MKVSKATKPSVIDAAKEFGFHNQRVPSVGVGALKPNLGRGGQKVPDDYYDKDTDLQVNKKKHQEKVSDKAKTSWADVI